MRGAYFFDLSHNIITMRRRRKTRSSLYTEKNRSMYEGIGDLYEQYQ